MCSQRGETVRSGLWRLNVKHSAGANAFLWCFQALTGLTPSPAQLAMAPPASFFLRATNGLLLACGVALAAVGGYQLTGGDAELPEVPYLGAWSGPLLLAVGGSVTLLAAVGCCAAASHGAATWAYLLALQVSRRRGWEARGGVSGLACWRCQGCRPRRRRPMPSRCVCGCLAG